MKTILKFISRNKWIIAIALVIITLLNLLVTKKISYLVNSQWNLLFKQFSISSWLLTSVSGLVVLGIITGVFYDLLKKITEIIINGGKEDDFTSFINSLPSFSKNMNSNVSPFYYKSGKVPYVERNKENEELDKFYAEWDKVPMIPLRASEEEKKGKK